MSVLHWLDIHWLNAAAIAAIAGVVAALIPLYTWLQDRGQTERSPSQQARERDMMLRRVRRKWITDVLEPSLAHTATLTLGLHTRPDVLHIPRGRARGRAARHEPAPEQKPILKVFHEAGGSLLIVGAPGAGKTTLLLQLASALIDRAESDPSQAIPLVVNLESWAAHRLPLDQWLIAELTGSYYKVPPKTANDWIETGELILLLDGLDEVEEQHRSDCAAAISSYQGTHGLDGLVVCSRTSELQQMTVTLELKEAVELQPLTDSQVSDFLDRLEESGTPLGMVRAELAADEALRELLSSPLTLSVVALAYDGREPTALAKRGNITERQAMLWEAYILRMFEQRPLPGRCRYTPGQAVTWLGWLALALQRKGQSEFRLDRLTYQWLPDIPRKLQGPPDPAQLRWEQHFALQPIDLHLKMSEELGRRNGPFKPAAMAVMFTQFFALLYATLIAGIGTGLATGFLEGPAAGLISAVITIPAGLVISGAFFIAGALGCVELARVWSSKSSSPNDGIRYAARYAAYTALAAFLAFGGCAALGFGQAGYTPSLGAAAAVCIGLWFAFVLGLISGGHICLQHYAVRIALVRAKAAPWRLGPFLDAMAARLLLLRSGGSYQFTHRLLRDYLADNAAWEEFARTMDSLVAPHARSRSRSRF